MEKIRENKRLQGFLLAIVTILITSVGYGYFQNANVSDAASAILTKSAANYFPGTSGWLVSDAEYFSYLITCTETTGTVAGGVGVTIQTNFDKDATVAATGTWKTYTQPVIYPLDAAACATLTIADEVAHAGSIHPHLCKRIRFVLTEVAGQEDIYGEVRFMKQ